MRSPKKSVWSAVTPKDRQKITWLGRTIHIVVPSVVKPGEAFCVKLSAVGADHMPLADAVPLKFLNLEAWQGIPERGEIPAEDLRLENVSIEKEGTYYLSARANGPEDKQATTVYSNPIWVTDDAPSRLFWGDIHIHSIDGWCQPYAAKSPRLGMSYARDVTFLDFAAITDHTEKLDDTKWAGQKSLVREFDCPGTFVPFLGFESAHQTHDGGDNNVYFQGYEGSYFPAQENALDKPLEQLWEFLRARGQEFMTIPHHTGRKGKYRSWDGGRYNRELEMLFEVYSIWGSSECRASQYPLWQGSTEEPAYLQDALTRGCRFGVVASSDDHTTLPGSESLLAQPGREGYGTYAHHGLMGVFTAKLERGALWKAMKNRRTMAATCGRPILFFQAQDYQAGSEIDVNSDKSLATKRHLKIKIAPAFPERSNLLLTVFRNGSPLLEKPTDFSSQGESGQFEFVDEAPIDDILIADAPFSERPFVFYYARLDGEQGGTAWSSPICFVR